MYFNFPQAFLLLLVFPLIFWILSKSEKRTRKAADFYKGVAPPRTYFIIRSVLIFVFLGSLAVIAARPNIEFRKTGDFLFLVDVSRSMDARYSCGELTFLDRSKVLMRNVLRNIPEAKFGIIAFDRFAFPVSQMTYDHVYLNEVIDEGLYVGLFYQATRTDISNALSLVARKKNRLPDIYGGVRQVVLLSDGFVDGDYRRRMAAPLAELREADIEIISVGIGNPGETPLMDTEGSQCIDEQLELNGEVVMIPLRDDVLKHISGETEGQYFSEGETDRVVELLRGRMEDVASEEDDPTEAAHGRDISWLFLLIASISLLGIILTGTNIRIDRSVFRWSKYWSPGQPRL